ncbi:MAG TPA: PA2779 family protein [Woeseiaceae bacterium]
MRHSCSIRMIAVFMMANMAGLGFVPSAQGAVVGTETALASQQRAERIERLNSVLARDDVRAELERLGVAPADAQARVAALSDSELLALDQRMDELPAGSGALEVLGIVLLVLLVLELVGVTDIFKRL